MIKLQSIIPTNKFYEHKELTLLMDYKKINYVYSQNKTLVNEIFLVSNGLQKPILGSVIYDDWNLIDMKASDRSDFIQDNIDTILPFYNSDRKLTVIKVLKRHIVFCNLSNLFQEIEIKQLLQEFNLLDLANTIIEHLTNKQLIKLYIMLSIVKRPKYVLIHDLEKYLFSFDSFNFFLKELKKHHNFDTTFVIFSNQMIENKEEFNIFNLDDPLIEKNSTMLICDKSFKKQKRTNKFNFNLILELIKSNYFLMLLFFIINASLITILSLTNVSIENFLFALQSNAYDSKYNNFYVNTISYVSITIMFLVNFIYAYFFFYNNLNFFTRLATCGQNIIKILFNYLVILSVPFISSFIMGLIVPFYSLSQSTYHINWFFIAFFPILIFGISFLIFVFLYVFRYRKILRKNNELV